MSTLIELIDKLMKEADMDIKTMVASIFILSLILGFINYFALKGAYKKLQAISDDPPQNRRFIKKWGLIYFSSLLIFLVALLSFLSLDRGASFAFELSFLITFIYIILISILMTKAGNLWGRNIPAIVKKRWNIDTGEKEYVIEFFLDEKSRKKRLLVNGEKIRLSSPPLPSLMGLDQPIFVGGGKDCHFVLLGDKADVALDGRYLDSKKPYVQFNKIPLWGWFFIIACSAIPVVFFGGIFPILFGIVGILYCFKILLSPFIITWNKVFYCFLLTAFSWASTELVIYAQTIHS
jgi:hypothetical protein